MKKKLEEIIHLDLPKLHLTLDDLAWIEGELARESRGAEIEIGEHVFKNVQDLDANKHVFSRRTVDKATIRGRLRDNPIASESVNVHLGSPAYVSYWRENTVCEVLARRIFDGLRSRTHSQFREHLPKVLIAATYVLSLFLLYGSELIWGMDVPRFVPLGALISIVIATGVGFYRAAIRKEPYVILRWRRDRVPLLSPTQMARGLAWLLAAIVGALIYAAAESRVPQLLDYFGL